MEIGEESDLRCAAVAAATSFKLDTPPTYWLQSRDTERCSHDNDRELRELPFSTRESNGSSGVLVIGGDYRALTVVRSFGRHGIPAWVLVSGQSIATKSRYALKKFKWPGQEAGQVKALARLATEYGLMRWLLFPTDDNHAIMIARHRSTLTRYFTVATSPWEVIQWAFDKRLTYLLAEKLKIAHPRTAYPHDRKILASLDFSFPAILKPAFKEADNRFTRAKAWLVQNYEELFARYDEACSLVGPSAVMVQELIPGGGEYQFSFGALCLDGKPLATVTVRRRRQYPVDFGRSSSYVETIENDDVERGAREILQALRFTGLVEVEFKQDPRDLQYKILELNPRIWGWHTIGLKAGIDFPYLFWRLAHGEPVEEIRARSGLRWARTVTDLPAAVTEIWQGTTSLASYLSSLREPREHAVFAADDLLPVFLEAPMLLAWRLRLAIGEAWSRLRDHPLTSLYRWLAAYLQKKPAVPMDPDLPIASTTARRSHSN
jgi:D-aspartate ligase